MDDCFCNSMVLIRDKEEQNMCQVSVIVPVYNAKQYLDRCVESLVGQTLSDIEIILVDDLSHGRVVAEDVGMGDEIPGQSEDCPGEGKGFCWWGQECGYPYGPR